MHRERAWGLRACSRAGGLALTGRPSIPRAGSGKHGSRVAENIHWLSNEESMIYYFEQLMETVWPKGQLGGAWPTRTLEQRETLKAAARSKLVSAITGTGRRACMPRRRGLRGGR